MFYKEDVEAFDLCPSTNVAANHTRAMVLVDDGHHMFSFVCPAEPV